MTEQAALATRADQHPLSSALEERMPALAEILPGGEEQARRFKRVVIQAIVKTPDLMGCSPASLVSAVMESATIGFEPTGTLGGAHLVPYRGKAQLIIGYSGLIALARRSGAVDTIEARVVRKGDDFGYEYGTNAHVRHVPSFDAEDRDDPITHVYAVAKLRGGGVQFEVMTFEQVEAIRKKSPMGHTGPWRDHWPEMARKTAVRRLAKYLPLAEAARDIIARDDEREFEPGAVVSRVAETRASQARQRIAQRTAAMRGESVESGESEAGVPEGGAEPAGSSSETVPAGGSPVYEGEVLDVDDLPDVPDQPAGDPWMRRLHAVGAERGMDHDAIHALAVELFNVDSLTDLDESERAELLDRIEDDASQDGEPAVARQSAPPSDTPSEVDKAPATATVQAEATSPPGGNQPAPAISDPDTLRTYAAAVLKMDAGDVWGLPDLSPADWDEIWDSLGLAELEAYVAWFNGQKRPLRQVLMASRQSPRSRKEWIAAGQAA